MIEFKYYKQIQKLCKKAQSKPNQRKEDQESI